MKAFPIFVPNEGAESGMDLRDFFAAAAMQGFLSIPFAQDYDLYNRQSLAKMAYKIADEMILARNTKN